MNEEQAAELRAALINLNAEELVQTMSIVAELMIPEDIASALGRTLTEGELVALIEGLTFVQGSKKGSAS